MKQINEFQKCLAASHAAEDLPFWEEIYKKAFPNMQAMISHRMNGEHQKAGIDRSIIFDNSKQILIDEKVRFKDYGDIALEYLGDRDKGIPGWVCKPLRADYIAYAIAPAGRCYLLPVIQLQKAWIANKDEWLKNYPPIKAENGENKKVEWVTLCCPVPVHVLFSEVGKQLRINFQPFEESTQ